MLSLITKKPGETTMPSTLHYIPLTSAYLCTDCNCVSNCSRQCPACASEALMGLSGILNREVEEIQEPSYSYVTALVA